MLSPTHATHVYARPPTSHAPSRWYMLMMKSNNENVYSSIRWNVAGTLEDTVNPIMLTMGEIRLDTFFENLLEIVWNSSCRSNGVNMEVGLGVIPRVTCGGANGSFALQEWAEELVESSLWWYISQFLSGLIFKWILVPEWSRLNWVNWASATSAVHR